VDDGFRREKKEKVFWNDKNGVEHHNEFLHFFSVNKIVLVRTRKNNIEA
jgi:hypothetical protein